MPMGFPPDALESGMAYVPSDTDIFIASYPKCGTTWLQYIVYLLLKQPPLGPDDLLADYFPHLEEVGAPAVEALPGPRLIKTHLRRDMAPFSPSVPYLVICRNPFDCAVSFFHHTRGFPRHYDFSDGSFADFFDCFIEGEIDFGDYFKHFVSWHAEFGHDNIFFMTYEALMRDTKGMIRRIASFLGERVSASIAADEDLDSLIEETSLVSMSSDQQRWSSARPQWATAFVRKGEIGDWRSLFTPSQARLLLAKFDRQLRDAEIENPWPDELAEVRLFAGTDG